MESISYSIRSFIKNKILFSIDSLPPKIPTFARVYQNKRVLEYFFHVRGALKGRAEIIPIDLIQVILAEGRYRKVPLFCLIKKLIENEKESSDANESLLCRHADI